MDTELTDIMDYLPGEIPMYSNFSLFRGDGRSVINTEFRKVGYHKGHAHAPDERSQKLVDELLKGVDASDPHAVRERLQQEAGVVASINSCISSLGVVSDFSDDTLQTVPRLRAFCALHHIPFNKKDLKVELRKSTLKHWCEQNQIALMDNKRFRQITGNTTGERRTRPCFSTLRSAADAREHS